MTNTWNKLWKQIDTASKEFNNYMESGIPLIAEKKVSKFVKEFDKVKDLIEAFDKFMQNPIEPIEVTLPFEEEEFVKVWNFWKEYRMESFGKAYKSREEQKVLNYLAEISEDRPDLAIKYLNFAMAGSYPKFFKVTEKNYSNPKIPNSDEDSSNFD